MQELNYPIAWKDEYSMEVKEIDDQHKHFVSILNNLYTAMEKMELQEHTEEILKELGTYAVEHFATEEKYFDLFNYEDSVEHKAEHQSLLDRVNELMYKYSKDGTIIVPELLDFLENWLVHHLDNFDKKYVKCFKANGLV